MQLKTNGMRFRFENKRYIANMTAREISEDSVAGSKNKNLPIKLPDEDLLKLTAGVAPALPNLVPIVLKLSTIVGWKNMRLQK